MKLLLSAVIILFCVKSYSQLHLDEVNYQMINQKSVREYIKSQKEHNIDCFTELIPSCFVEKDMSNYSIHMATYMVKDSIGKVWATYKKANPYKVWEGRIVSFGLLYSRKSDNVLYRNTKYNGLEEGQIIYLNLKLLKGIYNLATSFEIVDVDNKKRTIKFSYIDGGKARGIQTLEFVPTRRGYTRIIHTTEYKSNSYIRDKYFYGHFHKKCINQFHRNVKRMVYEKRYNKDIS